MNKRILAAVFGLVMMLGFSVSAHARSSYATSFKSTYPSSPLSSLSTQSGVSGNLCTLCHGTSGGSRNSYGSAYSSNNNSFTAIQNSDSDSDGFTNLAEINAGTFPGNASSKPSAGGDATAPTMTGFSIPSTSSSLTVSFTAVPSATDNVGVTGYLVRESSATPTAATTGWVTTAPTAFTFTSQGAKTLFAWAKDAAGNVSASRSDSVTITLTTPPPPVNGAALYNTNCSGCHGALASSEKLGSSASQIQGAIDGDSGGMGSLSGLTATEVQAIATALASAPPPTDTTAPTVTFAVPSTSNSLTVLFTTLTAADNVGVTGYMVKESSAAPTAATAGWGTFAPNGYSFTTQGAKTLYAWAKDAAGNVSAVKSDTVTVTLTVVDTVPPSLGFALPASSSSLTVNFGTLSATDSVGVTGYMVKESSVAPTAAAAGWMMPGPTSYNFASEGVKTLYAWAKDAAGNVSAVKSDSVTITLTTPPPPPPPGVSGVISPATSGLYWDDTNKRLGIGTESPASKLSITDEATSNFRGFVVSQHTSDRASAIQMFRKSRGTEALPLSVLDGDYVGTYLFRSHDGASYLRNAYIGALVNGPVTAGSVPTELFFATSSGDDPDPYANGHVRMVISPIGDIGIGTIDPMQKLEVNGGVRLNPDPAVEPKPVCNVNSRGTFWFTQDDAAGDSADVCARVAGAYAWRKLF